MNKQNFETAAKVLFFGTLEESFAIETAKKTIHIKSEQELLEWLEQSLRKRKTKHRVSKVPMQGVFSFPVGTDLSYWREFKTNCISNDFLAVLYKWIGGFEDDLICKTFDMSKGTLYSRYNKGLMKLGEYLIDRQTSLGV